MAGVSGDSIIESIDGIGTLVGYVIGHVLAGIILNIKGDIRGGDEN